MLGRTDSRSRALVFLAVLVLIAGALVARLAYWQVVRHEDLSARAAQQTSLRYEEPAERGSIYDRTGTVTLATTVQRDRLAAVPKLLKPERREEVADALVTLLGLEGDAAATLRERMQSEREYVILARNLLPQMSERIRELSKGKDAQLAGLLLEPEQVRVYPQEGGAPDSTLAAHMLGFVNREGVGQYGVEQFYQDGLAGLPRAYAAQRDINGRAIPETAAILEPGVQGQDIILTLDASLQAALEAELFAAWVADDARRVSGVVMDPYTGEVFAYGTYPSYDANGYGAIASEAPERFVDPNVSTVYEPGSVFKMLTAAAALETGTVGMLTEIKDQGTLKLDKGRTKIDNADHKSMGVMTFEDAIAYSRNVVAAKVALALGDTTGEAARTLYATWRELGIGSPTGIDLAGEVGGIARDPAVTQWREIDLANGSFGQGVAVTPIQLAQTFSAMVNGGTLVQPRVVKSIGDLETNPVLKGRVMTPEVSAHMRSLMRNVIDEVPFYRDRTLIPGYEVGGKTGTAQIWDPKMHGGRGGWKVNLFNYSFVGYVAREADRPDLVIGVRIEEGRPTIRGLGQLEMPMMSFELFRRIAHDAITTPDLLPEHAVRELPPGVGW
jgi:cell division protein FtsI/penicillin-binding protein 2